MIRAVLVVCIRTLGEPGALRDLIRVFTNRVQALQLSKSYTVRTLVSPNEHLSLPKQSSMVVALLAFRIG